MKDANDELFQAREFAARTGVTVRTLHHYDRIGLLKPCRRTSAGYRLYGGREFARLQQIVTLKFVGFSLKQIKEILGRQEADLRSTLKLQRELIEAQRSRLNVALLAIGQAENALKDGQTDWEAFRKITEVIDMEQNMDWAKKYYSEEAQQKIEERKKLWSPELQAQVTKDWNALIKDVEMAMSEGAEPSSERAQSLAARWSELVRGFTGGDPEIQAGLNRMYADSQNWQGNFKKPFSDEVGAFICQAMKTQKQE